MTLGADPSAAPDVRRLKEHQCLLSVKAEDRDVELAIKKIKKWLEKGNFVKVELNTAKVRKSKSDEELEGDGEAVKQAKIMEARVRKKSPSISVKLGREN